MPPHQGAVSAAAAASSSMHSQFGGASMHHMAAPFGSSFGGMVRIFPKKPIYIWYLLLLSRAVVSF